MTQAELLEAIKVGLSISGNYNDVLLNQKISAVKNYMTNAGITEVNLYSPLGVEAITTGVTDLWNYTGQEIKFSRAFEMFVEQLYIIGLS